MHKSRYGETWRYLMKVSGWREVGCFDIDNEMCEGVADVGCPQPYGPSGLGITG